MTTRTGRSAARARVRPHPVLLASRPEGPDAEASALVDLLDDALAHGTDALSVDIDRRSVALSNLTKRYFPQGGPGARTKGDMVRYYLAVAPVILPHLAEPFDPSKYRDEYEDKLHEIIKAKAKGKKLAIADAREPEQTKVVDLVSRLQESLEASAGGKRPRASAKVAAHKRAAKSARRKTA